MRTTVVTIVAMLAGAACGARAAEVTSPAPVAKATPGFAFDWSPPCRVPVVEVTDIDGDKARLRYVIFAQRAADNNLEVRMQDFEMLEMGGQDVTSPEWKARLAPSMAMAEAIPAMRVSPAGAFLGTENPEALLERLLAARHYDPAKEAAMRKMLLAPGTVALYDELVGAYWRGWVEYWIDWSLAPGASQEAQGSRFEYLGLHDGVASLRLTSVVEGADARREQINAVDTDPATLRPRHTRSQVDATVSFKDGTSKTRHEVHDLTWDWARAEGCGRKP